MPANRFIALETETARHYLRGGADANGHTPERKISDGGGVPCRHCLSQVAAGEAYLILAHRPFPEAQPYAETGPIFLHADECARYDSEREVPEMFRGWERLMLRGYGADNRIVYGTGTVIGTGEIEETAARILDHPEVEFVHARSASNNCYQCRIEREA